MEDIWKLTIVETVDTAKEYASKLEDLIKSVEVAKEQVNASTQKAIEDIDSAFDLFTSVLVDALHKRRNVLKAEAFRFQEEGLIPLKECHDLIAGKLKSTKLYVEEGHNILRAGGLSSSEETLMFSEKASLLGSLPAVPSLEEVPDISFQCPVESVRVKLQQTLSGVGKVSRMGPVQVTEVDEKPGALLVRWEEVDFERVVDIHSFRLQMAYDDVRGQMSLLKGNFHDIYFGPECQYLVRDLCPGVPYTFRVSCQVEGDIEWSAWSLPHVATTNYAPFCWDLSNSNYKITNENKIATKTSTDQSVLFSSSAQFGPGHSIEFTVLDCGVGCSDEGVGLVDTRVKGSVFVDGREKTTKLPRLDKGSKVSFTCEHIRDSKVRVNIDSNNKTVTYDWNISSPDLKLSFAICFGECNWKVLVE
ncbi:cytokine receptor-like factor 3 isoform X2 [Zootermopsis nevadensis]|uniref:cytokine receptor-like factor 3 isoform X2 n=1 Tax=Zootermopsis nevadensis TaxID=136037 RepID=UPI000B8E8F69|nr:cytokine receptor-like factor 3 isoform X2 [Zootermopsis nevadensis]